MPSEDISIIVMTYNRAMLLSSCLDTLTRQKYQKDKLEIIIVDDGSTDNTRFVAEAFCSKNRQIRYIFQNNQGIGAARNAGIKNARGGILAFVADDYLFPDNYAENICRYFNENPASQAVRFKLAAAGNNFLSRALHFHDEVDVKSNLCKENIGWSASLRKRFAKRFERIQVNSNDLIPTKTLSASGAAAYRKNVFRTVGLFNERLRRYEDIEFAARMREKGITMFYCGSLEVLRVYGPKIAKELKRNFWDGYYDCLCQDLCDGYSKLVSGRVRPSSIKKIFNQCIKLGISPIWRARQVESIGIFFVYLTLFYSLEFLYSIGFFWKVLRK